jgi:hypothetical protein
MGLSCVVRKMPHAEHFRQKASKNEKKETKIFAQRK